jgi:hypothetical protein
LSQVANNCITAVEEIRMPNPNAVVDTVRTITGIPEAAAAPGTTINRMTSVAFAGGRSGMLDLASPRSAVWAGVLASLQESGSPAYVEIDPASGMITNLLAPLVVLVGEIGDAEGEEVPVELIISHGRHFVRRSNPDFNLLIDTLRRARDEEGAVAVTEQPDTHEIIDVKPVTRPKWAESLAEGAAAPPDGTTVASPVTAARAAELYRLANARLCCPAAAAAPCIPFAYPDDGCWGRAHEMSRLMIAAGTTPEKVWIFGSLRTPTINHPNCQVNWGWHVAPTVTVNGVVTVIDPSLFPGPVTRDQWKSVQGDAAAQLVGTPWTVFWRNRTGSSSVTDPSFTETNNVLNTYRNQLRLRATGPAGPPPYPNCMTRPSGTQWIGVVNGGATQSWFTHSWPARWHVLWTVMPMTACPGGPQLTWSVRVERASAEHCTYWIQVTNLTPNAVRFEGRFHVLSR